MWEAANGEIQPSVPSVSLNMLRHKMLTFELLNFASTWIDTNLCSGKQPTFKMMPEYFSWAIISYPDHQGPLSETSPLSLCSGNIRCWYSLKYDMNIPFPTSRGHLRFHNENLISSLIIGSHLWYISRDLHPINTMMFGSNLTGCNTSLRPSPWNP